MRRIVCLLAILAGASAFALAGVAPPTQDPPDEDGLWSRISEHINKGRQVDAASALQRFLDEFPKSSRIPEALYQLSLIHI